MFIPSTVKRPVSFFFQAEDGIPGRDVTGVQTCALPIYSEARIEINPADATRLTIKDGQTVRVSSRRGSIVLRGWVTQRTTVGVVFIPMHFAEAAANLDRKSVV